MALLDLQGMESEAPQSGGSGASGESCPSDVSLTLCEGPSGVSLLLCH